MATETRTEWLGIAWSRESLPSVWADLDTNVEHEHQWLPIGCHRIGNARVLYGDFRQERFR